MGLLWNRPLHQSDECLQLIVRVTVVLCVRVPDVPLRVSVRLPVFVFPPTVIVTVACAELVPFSATGDGEMLQVVWFGTPPQERETLPVKPPRGDTVRV